MHAEFLCIKRRVNPVDIRCTEVQTSNSTDFRLSGHFRQVCGMVVRLLRGRPLVDHGEVGVRVVEVLPRLLLLLVEVLLLVLRLRRVGQRRGRRHGAGRAVQERVGGGEAREVLLNRPLVGLLRRHRPSRHGGLSLR